VRNPSSDRTGIRRWGFEGSMYDYDYVGVRGRGEGEMKWKDILA